MLIYLFQLILLISLVFSQGTYDGCYKDTQDRALPYGPGRGSYNRGTCYQACIQYQYFGLQANGQCFCGNSETEAKQYGISGNCPGGQNGLGGQWANTLFKTNINLLKKQNGKFFAIPVRMTFFDSISYCRENNAELASILNINELNQARNVCQQINDNCWIGANDLKLEGSYKWIDNTLIDNYAPGFSSQGTPVSGYPWNVGQPDNTGNIEDCIHLWKNAGYNYNDASCQAVFAVPLCKSP